jgi:hypothetical protein
MTFVRSAYKAIGSGVSAAIPTAILVADNGITLVEWLMVAGAFLAGAGFTYALPANRPVA